MKTPPLIRQADNCIDSAALHLSEYIQNRITEAGGEKALSAETGVPRSTINDTLRRGGVLGLRSLAYRLMKKDGRK